MEKESEIINIKPKSMFAAISIVQSVCIGVLLIAVLIIKLWFNGAFVKLEDFCKNNVLEPTKITADFNGE